MNKFTLASLAVGSLIAMTSVASAAGYDTPGIDRRQANQEYRIEQGLRDGSLTRKEYNQLIEDQERIARMERNAKRDGVVTQRERERIRAALAKENRDIFAEKHDNQTADRRHAGKHHRYDRSNRHDNRPSFYNPVIVFKWFN